MTTMRNALAAAVLAAVAVQARAAHAGFQVPKHPEAPRFVVPEGAQLPLKGTHHNVRVVGPVAHVTITQTYLNAGEDLLDATYVFPGSTGSAVASLVMKVGDRTVRAVLKKKEEARADFEAARQAGLRASLLEQKRPNVFQMGLTNIRPGETVEVILGYTELLEPEDGQYELVLPAVVAPRFGGEAEGLGERPTLAAGQPAPSWTADVKLADGLGVVEVSSPTHPVSPQVDRQGQVQIKASTPGNKEWVLNWRLAQGRESAAGLTLYEGEDENFFMMTVAPPARVAADQIPPRQIDFVLDVSCSMRGFPLDVAKVVMRDSLGKLRPTDRFNIHFFAGSGWTFAEAPVPATPAEVNRALGIVNQQRGGGGTQLVQAIGAVARLPRAPGLARTIVVVTDGLVGFEKRAFTEVRKKLGDTAVFTLGIGSNVNRMLVEGLARAGGGVSYVAHDAQGARKEAERLLVAIRAPVLTDLNLQIEGLSAYDLEPPVLPTLYSDRPVVVVGKYKGQAQGTLRLSGLATNRSFEQSLSVNAVRATDANAPLRALWARRRLQRVADDRALVDGGADKATITQLGLKYGLLTQHTAFVAVDSEGGAAQGSKRSVTQPGPHPDGMARQAGYAASPQMMRKRSAVQGGRSSMLMDMSSKGLGGLGSGSGGGGYGRGGRAVPSAPRPPPAAEAVPLKEKEASTEEDSVQRVRVSFAAPILLKGEWNRSALEKTLAQAKRKIAALLKAEAGPGARVVVDIEVGPDGRVKSVKVVDSSGLSASLQSRLTKELKRMRFPQQPTPGSFRWPINVR